MSLFQKHENAFSKFNGNRIATVLFYVSADIFSFYIAGQPHQLPDLKYFPVLGVPEQRNSFRTPRPSQIRSRDLRHPATTAQFVGPPRSSIYIKNTTPINSPIVCAVVTGWGGFPGLKFLIGSGGGVLGSDQIIGVVVLRIIITYI